MTGLRALAVVLTLQAALSGCAALSHGAALHDGAALNDNTALNDDTVLNDGAVLNDNTALNDNTVLNDGAVLNDDTALNDDTVSTPTVNTTPSHAAPAVNPEPVDASMVLPATPVQFVPSTTEPAEPTTHDAATALIAGMPLRDRVASLLMFHVPGTDPAAMAEFVAVNQPGGLIMMADNIAGSATTVAAVSAAAQSASPLAGVAPLLIAVDQEGGDVSRLPADAWPAGRALHDQPTATVAEAFSERGQLAAGAGLNVNFGVVADVTGDTGSFIFRRTLGSTPKTAAEHVSGAVIAEQAMGVLSTLKHFPGHGAAPGDSHISIPTTGLSLQEWSTTHARPFRSGIVAGAEIVMMGHLRYTAIDAAPASLSTTWHTILRDDLGFDGLIISDDLGMLEHAGEAAYADRVTNAVNALNAGTSMLLFVADGPVPVAPAQVIDGIVGAVADGRVLEATIDDAATRVLEVRLGLLED